MLKNSTTVTLTNQSLHEYDYARVMLYTAYRNDMRCNFIITYQCLLGSVKREHEFIVM